jgi:hypothetical protein
MKRKHLTVIALVGALVLQAMHTPVLAEEEVQQSVEQQSAGQPLVAGEETLGDMELVAENEYLQMYLDPVETDVAILEKSSGEIWYTNPADLEQDTVATSYYQKLLKSQINLTYINEATQVSTMNNYANSIQDGQFEVSAVDNGIRITYMIGDSVAFLLLPEVITESRMQQFLEKMSSSQQKKIKRNYTLYESGASGNEEIASQYPVLEQENIYVLRGGVKDYMREELAEYLEEAGYTQEDYEIDSANVQGEETDENVWFEVPLTYQLDGENLVVTMNPEEVTYNTNGFYLVKIELLPYFGASMKDDGYLFVPDGSGALIYFNNGKMNENSYTASVYGQDETMLYTAWNESQVDAENTVKMPVFGIKDEDRALFAVIEEGDGYATINAGISGKTSSYNNVYASFSYLQYGETSLDDIVGANSYYMYSDAIFEGSYKVRYSFLTGEKADYSGMAETYRDYLIQNGVLTEKVADSDIPFFVEYIGAIDKPKTFLGVKYDATVALTTFAQAEEITAELKENGVDNINTIFSGWMNGGLHGTAATKLKVVSKLSAGGTSLKEFLQDMQEYGDTFLTLDLQYVYDDQLFDGYSNMQYAPRYFDNTTIKINDYGLASRVSEGTLASLISPYYVEKITSKLSDRLEKKNVTGVNLGTLSWELYSDLLSGSYTDRQMAKTHNTNAIQTLKESGQKLIGDNANSYVWEYADCLFNVPLASNNYRIIDEEIPFYEMVIHGYLTYAGEAFNMADDYTTMVLKSVESGAGIHFEWIYESNSVLKETDYDYLYSVNYESWFERAVETYNSINEEMGYLQSKTITKHERISDDVVKVTYEDGSRVYVNYSKEAVTADGIAIAAQSYHIEKGAE